MPTEEFASVYKGKMGLWAMTWDFSTIIGEAKHSGCAVGGHKSPGLVRVGNIPRFRIAYHQTAFLALESLMSNARLVPADADGSFIIYSGTHAGCFTLPNGSRYTIEKLQSKSVTDPVTGKTSKIYEGFGIAEDESLADADRMLIDDLRGKPGQSRELLPGVVTRPLEVQLLSHRGRQHTHIGIFWNVHGEWTVFARRLQCGAPAQFSGTIVRRGTEDEFGAEPQRNFEGSDPKLVRRVRQTKSKASSPAPGSS